MNNIKIFVSHRIDVNSELIENPIYVPMRCGAIFDADNPMQIAGDDTGDNISERRMSFCEFTVQYWAWKNADADYYGLCHYRRYLSFAEKYYKTDEYNMIHVPLLTQAEAKRYGLLRNDYMKQLISQYDIIVSEYADIRNVPTPSGRKNTLYEHWSAHEGVFFAPGAIKFLLELIDEFQPEFSTVSREYLSGFRHRGFNCYVLRKELFFRLCEFQFPIMFEVEKRLNMTQYTQTMIRTPAFFGEILYGIFIYYLTTREEHRFKELQLVFFTNTERLGSLPRQFVYHTWAYLDRLFRFCADPFFPKGTKRRELLKNFFYGVTRMKRRGIADPITVSEKNKK